MDKRITSSLDVSNKEASEWLEKIIEEMDKDESQISSKSDCLKKRRKKLTKNILPKNWQICVAL